MKKKEQIKALRVKIEEQKIKLIQCARIILDLRMQGMTEPANYREELKKLKEENKNLMAKLETQEPIEAIAETRPVDISILEGELRNITKKYSILKETLTKVRDIVTSL